MDFNFSAKLTGGQFEVPSMSCLVAHSKKIEVFILK